MASASGNQRFDAPIWEGVLFSQRGVFWDRSRCDAGASRTREGDKGLEAFMDAKLFLSPGDGHH